MRLDLLGVKGFGDALKANGRIDRERHGLSAHRRELPLLDHPAVEEMDRTVGMPLIPGVVRDHTDRGPSPVELSQQLHDGLSVGGVQVARRLVRQQNGRIASNRTRNGDPLLLSARELGRKVLHPMNHADAFKG